VFLVFCGLQNLPHYGIFIIARISAESAPCHLLEHKWVSLGQITSV